MGGIRSGMKRANKDKKTVMTGKPGGINVQAKSALLQQACVTTS